MVELLTSGNNAPFTVALLVMFAIAIAEGAAMVLGAGLSETLDAMLPDIDLEVDLDATGSSVFTRLLGWLHVGKVPILMILIVFLTAFGLIGLVMQSMVKGVTGFYLPAWFASAPALFLALPVVRVGAGALGAIMPNDETEAVSSNTFIGRTAVITLGEAKAGSPAEAKVIDEHGYSHYIMVEPDSEGVSFKQGSSVLLTENLGAVFRGIVSDSPGLREE